MSEYPSQEEFMQAHIEALEAELNFFRSQFPTAARNWQKATQQLLAVDETICSCSHDVYENVVSPGNCMACGKPFRH